MMDMEELRKSCAKLKKLLSLGFEERQVNLSKKREKSSSLTKQNQLLERKNNIVTKGSPFKLHKKQV